MANRTHITEVRTVAVPVTDQDRALDFYVDKLGFEKRLDATFSGDRRWIEGPFRALRRPSSSPLTERGTTALTRASAFDGRRRGRPRRAARPRRRH